MTSQASSSGTAPTHKHALTPIEKQRSQLDRLLKDPQKPVYIPAPPQAKTIRPAREMMKNVQGSSAGAGSGEFHVYKAGRRREYERLKILEEEAAKEAEAADFERKRHEAEEAANAKTAKNRARRQKKKERAKASKEADKETNPPSRKDAGQSLPDVPLKKRRLVNGTELVFKKPGEESEEVSDDERPLPSQEVEVTTAVLSTGKHPVVETTRITIVEDD